MHKGGKDEHRHTWYVTEKKPIPFFVIHIDFGGPFPMAAGRKEYIMGLIDVFTRFTILRGVTGPTSKNAIKVITEISQFFGLPAVVVSDNGTAFSSKEFQKFCNENEIRHSPVAVATPRANGQIERVFKIVKDSLKCLSNSENGGDWDKHLRTVQWAINSSENRVTKETPHKLLMGYDPRNALGNV